MLLIDISTVQVLSIPYLHSSIFTKAYMYNEILEIQVLCTSVVPDCDVYIHVHILSRVVCITTCSTHIVNAT